MEKDISSQWNSVNLRLCLFNKVHVSPRRRRRLFFAPHTASLSFNMDKLTSCLLQHGATTQIITKLSTDLHNRRSSLTPSVPGTRGSIRCTPTHARRATAARGSSVVNGLDFEGYLSRNAKAVNDALDTVLTGLRARRASAAWPRGRPRTRRSRARARV
jgi:hypothetical protein